MGRQRPATVPSADTHASHSRLCHAAEGRDWEDTRAELARRFPDVKQDVVIDVREAMTEHQAEAYDRCLVSEQRSQERAAERDAPADQRDTVPASS